MKLNILPARTGYLWVRSGFALFLYKPSAFIGFFASFMLALIVLGLVPYIGSYLSLLAFPALTLGMMAVGNECVKLKTGIILPMTPPPMLMGWMTLRRSARSLFQLGIWFAFGFAVILLVGAALDGGEFAKFYLQGGAIDKTKVQKDGFVNAVFITTLLYLPLTAVFWFSPALVNWKEMPIAKSMFFSLYAIYKNWRAFSVFTLVWAAVFSMVSAAALLLGSLILGAATASLLLMPLIVLLSTVFMASTFPTFVDCFQHSVTKNTTS
jgi:hypothetical protein